MRLKSALLGAIALGLVAGSASAQATTRGEDGQLNILYWQAVSILNPFLSGGTKDIEAASLVLEPLARYDAEANLVPYLAAEIPTLENGGVSADLTTITWKLKEGLLWSDGTPVTAADVIFTWQYCTAEGGGCAQVAKFDGVASVEALDDLTVKVTYSAPKPNPYLPFVGAQSPILQAAQFADCLGAAAPTCNDANTMPIGTGPFRVTAFAPNDVVSFEANPNYRDPSKPAFATVTFKGGGDAQTAARAVMETGEFDYAWNLQLAPDVLAQIAAGGKGMPISAFGTLLERIHINLTNPSAELPEGERSTVAHPHPFLTIPQVREALSIAIDRNLLVEVGYGEAGRAVCNLVPAPAIYTSDNTACLTQDLDRARALLEEAGFTDTDGDGVRENAEGVRLSILFQTSTNAVRQDFQALIQDWWKKIGVEVELRNIDASVYFSSDAGSPDTLEKFYADVEMYANNFEGTDPEAYLAEHMCDKIPSPATQWQGANHERFCDPAYDALAVQLSQTAVVEERAAIAIRMNDMLTKEGNVILPLVHRGRLSGVSNTLGGVVMNPWDSELWNIADWYRIDG